MEQITTYAPFIQKGLGTLLSSKGQKNAGKAQKQLADFQAAQLEYNAGQTTAAGQREAEMQDQETALLLSRAQAVAAASGGGAIDPTVLKIMAGIDAKGKLAADTTRYNADQRASGMRKQAVATRYEGAMSAAAGKMAATSTLLRGGGEIASAWGGSWAEEKEKNYEPSDGGYSTEKIDWTQ
jgi:hypothetical protein